VREQLDRPTERLGAIGAAGALDREDAAGPSMNARMRAWPGVGQAAVAHAVNLGVGGEPGRDPRISRDPGAHRGSRVVIEAGDPGIEAGGAVLETALSEAKQTTIGDPAVQPGPTGVLRVP
jgi:hypothetical protein